MDEKKNSPLHYACGYGKTFAVRALLAKARGVTDYKHSFDIAHPPPRFCMMMISRAPPPHVCMSIHPSGKSCSDLGWGACCEGPACEGCSTVAANGTGKTPVDLVKLEAKNPINQEPELLALLSV